MILLMKINATAAMKIIISGEYCRLYANGGGVQLVTFQEPRFPPKRDKNLSDWEKFIWQQKIVEEEFIQSCPFKVTVNEHWFNSAISGHTDKMKQVWDNRAFPFCNDFASYQEFFDAFQVPQSYINLAGYKQYIDYEGASIKTSNGYRVTTNQPSAAKRRIFFVGPSFLFSWGSTNYNTVESFLQRKLNEQGIKNNFIVYNRSFTGEDFERDFNTLRSIKYNQGDIVILAYAPIWGIPHCDRMTTARFLPTDIFAKTATA